MKKEIAKLKLLDDFLHFNFKGLFAKNLQYACLRAYYHIQNFYTYLKEIQNTFNRIDYEKGSGPIFLAIKMDVYFEFDAAIYSTKSVFEKGLLCDFKRESEEEYFIQYQKFCKHIKTNWDTINLKLRDDIVHLNQSGLSFPEKGTYSRGTTYGNVGKYDPLSKKVELQSIRMNDGKAINLIEKMDQIKNLLNEFVNSSIQILFKSQGYSIDQFDENMNFEIDGVEISIRDLFNNYE